MSAQAAEQLTLFQEDSRASRLASQESEKAETMTVTSGRKCAELSTNSGPLGLLEKMLLGSSLWSSRLVGLSWSARRLPCERVRTYEQYLPSGSDTPSPASCKTLSVSDMPSGYLYYRLVVSAQTTGATESQLLPTPTAALADHGGPNQRDSSGRPGLQMAAAMWATPNARDGHGPTGFKNQPSLPSQVKLFPTPRAKEAGDYCYSRGDHDKPTLTLSGAAKLWPTPTVPNGGRSVKHVEDWRSDRSAYHNGKKVQVDLNAAVKMFPTPKASMRGDCPSERNRRSPDLSSVVKMLPTPTTPRPHDNESTAGKYMPSQNQQDLAAAVAKDGGQLNPDWVEWLMGFPPGWTDIDADAEITPRDPQWWEIEPPIPRVATGIPHRVDRLKCLGNAVVPAQFYPIFAAIAAVESNNKL